MQAVILAAGRGTRMRSLTDNVPKPMLKIRNKPILEYTLDALPKEVDEVIFVVNYLKEKIEDYFGTESKGRKIWYVYQERLDGSGGAVRSARKYLKDKFLVLNGDDIYCKIDLERLAGENLAVLASKVENPSEYGVIKANGEGNLSEIVEKPEKPDSNLISTGAYILNGKFFDFELIPISENEFGLPQTVAAMAKEYPVKILMSHYWISVGNPEELEKAQSEIKKFT